MLAVGAKSVRNINMYFVLFGLDGHYMVTMAVKTLKKKYTYTLYNMLKRGFEKGF